MLKMPCIVTVLLLNLFLLDINKSTNKEKQSIMFINNRQEYVVPLNNLAVYCLGNYLYVSNVLSGPIILCR